MSLKRVMCVASFSSAVAITLYGAGCGSSSGGGTPDSGGGGQEATVMQKDSGGGKDVQSDIGTIGDGPTDSGGGTCAPGSASKFTPASKGSPGNLCSPSLLAGIVTACFSSTGTAAACMSAVQATKESMACYGQCIFSPYTATAWGGLVYDEFGTMADPGGQVTFINLTGCLQVANSGASACNTASTENLACQMTVCDTVGACALPAATFADGGANPAFMGAEDTLFTCYGEASSAGGPCATYGTAYQTMCDVSDAGVISLPDAGTQAAECFAIEKTLTSASTTADEAAQAILDLSTIICGAGFGALDGGDGG
jgi:hypothetical protein